MGGKRDWKRDLETVKLQARGRWVDILSQACGFSRDILDGRHHPCPKCSSDPDDDRFRYVDDADGACLCNQCFKSKNGDGVAAVAHFAGLSHREAMLKVAEILGLELLGGGGGKGSNGAAREGKPAEPPEPEKPKREFHDRLFVTERTLDEYLSWNPYVTAEAISAFGGGPKRWRYNGEPYECVYIPMCRQDGVVGGWIQSQTEGQLLPAKGEECKHRLLTGSEAKISVVGPLEQLKAIAEQRTQGAIRRIVRFEGQRDALAYYSELTPNERASTLVISPANGAGQKPPVWLFERIADWEAPYEFWAVADDDKEGREGATTWARTAARGKCCSVSKVINLYQPKGETKRDYRDWRADGHGKDELTSLAANADDVDWRPDAIRNFEEVEAGEKTVKRPLDLTTIIEEVKTVTDGWPRRVGEAIFSPTSDGKNVVFFKKTSKLFSHIQLNCRIEWAKTVGCVTKDEFKSGLEEAAQEHIGISKWPHFPPIEGMYYTCPTDVPPGDGEHLERLLDYFSFASWEYREIARAAFCTAFWGGPPGARPVFLVTASGRGFGKTKLCYVLSWLCGGVVPWEHSPHKTYGDRLVSPQYYYKRIVLLDNLKTFRFSDAAFESFVTSENVHGHQMYSGPGERPNLFTTFITVNGPGLSTDVAQRVVPIELAASTYSKSWDTEIKQFVDKHSEKIIQDIAGFYARAPQHISAVTRFGLWDGDHLTRLDEPDVLAGLIYRKRIELDAESEENESVLEAIDRHMERLNYGVWDAVWMPSEFLAAIYSDIEGKRVSRVWASRKLKQAIQEKSIDRVTQHRTSDARGFIWRGSDCTDDSKPYTDLMRRFGRRSF